MACQGGTIRMVKPYQIIHRAAFVRGFKEVLKGVPMDYDVYCDERRDRESYERGRLFGMVYRGPLKDGKIVTYQAQVALNDAFNMGAVI